MQSFVSLGCMVLEFWRRHTHWLFSTCKYHPWLCWQRDRDNLTLCFYVLSLQKYIHKKNILQSRCEQKINNSWIHQKEQSSVSFFTKHIFGLMTQWQSLPGVDNTLHVQRKWWHQSQGDLVKTARDQTVPSETVHTPSHFVVLQPQCKID